MGWSTQNWMVALYTSLTNFKKLKFSDKLKWKKEYMITSNLEKLLKKQNESSLKIRYLIF